MTADLAGPLGRREGPYSDIEPLIRATHADAETVTLGTRVAGQLEGLLAAYPALVGQLLQAPSPDAADDQRLVLREIRAMRQKITQLGGSGIDQLQAAVEAMKQEMRLKDQQAPDPLQALRRRLEILKLAINGWSAEEISDVLGIDPSEVRSNLKKARRDADEHLHRIGD